MTKISLKPTLSTAAEPHRPLLTEPRKFSDVSASAAPSDRILRMIEPATGWRAVTLRELWEYRGLLYFLWERGVQIRYKQTVAGRWS
jgi:hypothetical protein